MTQEFEFFYILSGVFRLLLQIVIIVATGLLWFKKRGVASGMMFSGSVLTLLFSGFSFLGTAFVSYQGAEFLVKFNAYFGIISLIPYLIFAVGLLLFAVQYLKK